MQKITVPLPSSEEWNNLIAQIIDFVMDLRPEFQVAVVGGGTFIVIAAAISFYKIRNNR